MSHGLVRRYALLTADLSDDYVSGRYRLTLATREDPNIDLRRYPTSQWYNDGRPDFINAGPASIPDAARLTAVLHGRPGRLIPAMPSGGKGLYGNHDSLRFENDVSEGEFTQSHGDVAQTTVAVLAPSSSAARWQGLGSGAPVARCIFPPTQPNCTKSSLPMDGPFQQLSWELIWENCSSPLYMACLGLCPDGYDGNPTLTCAVGAGGHPFWQASGSACQPACSVIRASGFAGSLAFVNGNYSFSGRLSFTAGIASGVKWIEPHDGPGGQWLTYASPYEHDPGWNNFSSTYADTEASVRRDYLPRFSSPMYRMSLADQRTSAGDDADSELPPLPMAGQPNDGLALIPHHFWEPGSRVSEAREPLTGPMWGISWGKTYADTCLTAGVWQGDTWSPGRGKPLAAQGPARRYIHARIHTLAHLCVSFLSIAHLPTQHARNFDVADLRAIKALTTHHFIPRLPRLIAPCHLMWHSACTLPPT